MNRSAQHIHQQMMNLRALAELLGVEADRLHAAGARQALCRESVMTINVLLPKLKAAAHALLEHEGEELPQQRTGLCENCDD